MSALGAFGIVGAGVWAGTDQLPSLQLPVPSPTKDRSGTSEDELAIRIQKALAADSQLEGHRLNLLVNVIDGVAVIGGPVPDGALLPSIEQVVKSVNGVRNVKVSVWVQPNRPTDPLIGQVGESFVSRPRQIESKPRPAIPTLSLPSDRVPAETSVASPVLLDPVINTTVARGDRNGMVPGASPQQYPNIPPTDLPTSPVVEDTEWSVFPANKSPDGFEQVITELRRDARFARLTATFRNGIATVGGSARNRVDVWEFASALREMPSVQRVVIGEVGTRK